MNNQSLKDKRPKVVLMYHYFYPDDVASSRYFTQLAEGLVKKNYDVTVLTTNRFRMCSGIEIQPTYEVWNDIKIKRVKRPPWDQGKYLHRLASSVWVMVKWLIEIYKISNPKYFVVGSNPEFSQALFFPIKLIHRKSKVYFWCFDLFPDAIIADQKSKLIRTFFWPIDKFLNLCYRYCDGIVDLGVSMRKRMGKYKNISHFSTITPWALVEVEQNSNTNKTSELTIEPLFKGSGVKLLYSGSIAKPHCFTLAFEFARALKQEEKTSSELVFACQGQRKNELIKSITCDDTNISVKDFLPERTLKYHLQEADFIVVSIASGWEGIVLPSKFFGALAIGKPILFFGSKNCEFSIWIKRFKLGFSVSSSEEIRDVIRQMKVIKNDQNKYKEMSENCFNIYEKYFSRESAINNWDNYLQFESINELTI